MKQIIAITLLLMCSSFGYAQRNNNNQRRTTTVTNSNSAKQKQAGVSITFDKRTNSIIYGNKRYSLIKVDGGAFNMGATPEQVEAPIVTSSNKYFTLTDDKDIYAKPIHKVTVSSFFMGQTEVTQGLWKAVMGKNPSVYKNDNFPVENISWHDCQTFIKRLNAKTGLKFRLPTEAEWEFAARGGNKSQGYKYSGSNDVYEVAWFAENSDNKTHEVGKKKPNELGIYDMSGNVCEWCHDLFDTYNEYDTNNPTGAKESETRVNRGGDFKNKAYYSRSSCRYDNAPEAAGETLGLRLVLNL